jgi:pseudouridine-5'-phosphate glycosidase
VAAALASGAPVVALESTIISHGMPYPDNVACARGVEEVVTQHGAVPATVALIDGRIRIGLDDAGACPVGINTRHCPFKRTHSAPRLPTKRPPVALTPMLPASSTRPTPARPTTALERLGRAGPTARKCSRRDFASVLASRALGATTVAGTMMAAEMAGIGVFVTGGIGGVHRGAEATMDVSADLTELGRTPVAVVCAGVKSILDIGKTLEYLETQGVPVVALGADEFPAFFTPHSGLKAPERMDSPAGA